jgi:DNA-binding PadR family transcriptional regulator
MAPPSDLNRIELLTLVAIARIGDEAYGVTIRQEIEDCSGRDVSMAAVYAALERLEGQRLIHAWVSGPRPQPAGRARRHFALTDDGRALVRRERSSALRMWRGVPAGATGRR